MELKIETRRISDYKSLLRTIKDALATNFNDITFTGESPQVSETESMSTPIITYRLESKTPGEFSSGMKEIKPRLRETIVVPETLFITGDEPVLEGLKKGGSMEVWGQMFDYVLEFKIYGSNTEEVDNIADKFQQFLFKYTGYFKKIGVSEMIFISMKSESDTSKSKLPTKIITYLFRVDEIVGVKIPVVESIGIEVKTYESTIARLVDIYIKEHTTSNVD